MVLLISVFSSVHASAQTSAQASASGSDSLQMVTSAENLPKSWAIAVSPNNVLFMTERAGVLHRFALDESKTLAELSSLAPINLALDDLYNKGQGGLQAIAFAPDYAQNPWIYLSYSFGSDDANGLKVIRIKLDQNKVLVKELLFTQQDLRATPAHYGARLAFASNGSLLLSTGDGFDYREQAQVSSSQLGKILRLTPSTATNEYDVEVYSRGHRNPQALLVMDNGQVISHEHGPEGGDEVNLIKQGDNYGWPVITQGRDYLGGLITPFVEYEGMQQPDYNWTPSIAPSGMIYYQGDRIAAFEQRLVVTSLKFQQLHTLKLANDVVSDENIYFTSSGFRLRDITQSQSGRVFLLSDGAQGANSTKIFEVALK